ncbi:Cytochrome P450 107B1 [Actinomadura rubteroloni]|uniref:Cytochrome P450 107B1 n=1 Tax=Actinomadura rubteroloni TaxID=1926885 RepID=A0A2P4UKN5_9ACTN|nr:cytochrome P450 [Actinomadura rubteroloni]POM25613.1 Cytochrome P450 107B1 [Actinomadura rubteroloni]
MPVPELDQLAASGAPPLDATTADPDGAFEKLWRGYGPVAPVELAPGVHAWLVMGYDELRTITRDEHLFSRDGRRWRLFQDGTVPPDSPLGPMMFFRDNVIGHDGEEHRRLRRPLQEAIAGVDHRRLRRTVERLCTGLIAQVAPRGTADLVADYAAAVPLLTIGELIGLDAAQSAELLAAMHLLFSSGEQAQEGNARFEALLGGLLAAKSAAPGPDVTSALLRHPDLRSDAEVLQTLVVLVSAGNHTLISWIAQALRLTLTDPRFASRVRGGRLSVDDALDEVLARQPPMINMPARYALADVELGGRRVARGDALILGLAAASRDTRAHTPGWWTHGNRASLAWSAGPHACPARDPARTIARTAVGAAGHLLRDMRVTEDPDAIGNEPSPWTRIPRRLPVAFTPASIDPVLV